MGVLDTFGSPGTRLLLAVAAPAEFRAVARGLGRPDTKMPERWQFVTIGRMDVLCTGVSKSNAAAAVAIAARPGTHAAVLSIGIGGAYDPALAPIGSLVLGTRSVFVDEGAATPQGFIGCAELGFPVSSATDVVIADPRLLNLLGPLCSASGPITTVSTCSGTDELARAYAARGEAIAEGMEGAAVGLAAAGVGIPFAEVRAISNTTGDRSRQVWDIPRALEALCGLVGRL
ncbi:MAG: Futalosine hydrolase [Phycisphaerales bacterium]|nr:Futalosine hydrolase [Phycisphaerales bacterium]